MRLGVLGTTTLQSWRSSIYLPNLFHIIYNHFFRRDIFPSTMVVNALAGTTILSLGQRKRHSWSAKGLHQRGSLFVQESIRTCRCTINNCCYWQFASSYYPGKSGDGEAKKYCVVETMDAKKVLKSTRMGRVLDSLLNLRLPEFMRYMVPHYFRGRPLLYSVKGNAGATWSQKPILTHTQTSLIYLLKLCIHDEIKII